MENPKETRYEVIITKPAEIHFYEVVEFLYDKYSLERAEQLADQLRDKTQSLCKHPKRGALEWRLESRENEYRFILFNRISRADIKIIYYVDDTTKKVFVVDFFPTEMDDKRIALRN